MGTGAGGSVSLSSMCAELCPAATNRMNRIDSIRAALAHASAMSRPVKAAGSGVPVRAVIASWLGRRGRGRFFLDLGLHEEVQGFHAAVARGGDHRRHDAV